VGKKQIGPSTQLYPMPALLVAVRTEGERAAILTIAWAGIVAGQPPMMALEIGSRHYSTPFIDREGSFTVNVPRADMAAGVDYCGSVSGTRDPDKAMTCGWTLAPSTQIPSPIIAECPVNMECRVVRRIEAGQGQFYLVEILETHVEEQALDDRGHPTAQGINPLIFTPDGEYYALGAHLGKAWQIGRQLGM
jgi:flavin reductase (DIM6/NTAB) family NADH-FMN oxidoreductase RutF